MLFPLASSPNTISETNQSNHSALLPSYNENINQVANNALTDTIQWEMPQAAASPVYASFNQNSGSTKETTTRTQTQFHKRSKNGNIERGADAKQARCAETAPSLAQQFKPHCTTTTSTQSSGSQNSQRTHLNQNAPISNINIKVNIRRNAGTTSQPLVNASVSIQGNTPLNSQQTETLSTTVPENVIAKNSAPWPTLNALPQNAAIQIVPQDAAPSIFFNEEALEETCKTLYQEFNSNDDANRKIEICLQLGRLYFDAGKYTKAIIYFTASVEWFIEGYNLSTYSDTESYLKKVEELQGDNLVTLGFYSQLAYLMQASGNIELLLQILPKLYALHIALANSHAELYAQLLTSANSIQKTD